MPTDPPTPQSEHDLDYGPTLRGLRAGLKFFERYELIRQLGRGGMGVVWLANDERLQVKVALKFLPEQLQNDRAAIDDLRRETRRCLALTHPYIVRIHDLAEGPEAAAISMEFVDGRTLTDLRLEKPQRCFEVAEITPWLRQMAEGLAYAHEEARIVHRDLKPSNLMLTHQGRIKIADFGISSHMQDTLSRTAMTQVNAGSGTLCYMSPQQFAGKPPAVTDDIYALGATLYELLTGKPPFYTGNIPHQVQHVTPQPVAERRKELHVESAEIIPPAWEQTLAACLDKDASLRPQSVREAVERLMGAEARSVNGKANIPFAPSQPVRQSTFRAPPIAAVITVAAIVIGIAVMQLKKPEMPKKVQPPATPSVQSKPGAEPKELAAPKAPLVVQAKNAGQVAKCLVTAGQEVKAGEPLILMESAELDAKVDWARAVVQLEQNKCDRYKNLHEFKAISTEDYNEAKAQLDMATASLHLAETQADDARITAPADGTVMRLLTETGAMVAPGMPLLEIVRSSPSRTASALLLSTDKPSYHSGEAVKCTLQIPVDGHLRVYSIDPHGDVTQIFPNRFEPNDLVWAGTTKHVPGNSAYDLTLELPQGLAKGTETIHAILSPEEFMPEGSPLAQGEDFRSLGRVPPEELRTRGLKVTAKPQTSVDSVSYEVLP